MSEPVSNDSSSPAARRGELATPQSQVRFTVAGAALFRLLDTVASLERLEPEAVASRGRLGLLRALARRGPRTMSALARDRGSSRQAVQRLARAMAREGLLEVLPNPRDRRAPLLALTARGGQVYRDLARSEASALNRMASGLEAGDLHAAARLLRRPRALPPGRERPAARSSS